MVDELDQEGILKSFNKLIDKSEDQEHIPFMVASLILIMWGILSGVFLRGVILVVSLVLLGLVVLALYVIYTRFGKRKKERKLLFNEIIDYFKLNLNSKKYIQASNNPYLEVVGLENKKNHVNLIVETQMTEHLKKNLNFQLIRIDKKKYAKQSFEFPTIFGYANLVEIGENSQVRLTEIVPTEKKYYVDVLKDLKKNKDTAIKNWKLKCHINEEFSNASIVDLENAYNLLLRIKNSED